MRSNFVTNPLIGDEASTIGQLTGNAVLTPSTPVVSTRSMLAGMWGRVGLSRLLSTAFEACNERFSMRPLASQIASPGIVVIE